MFRFINRMQRSRSAASSIGAQLARSYAPATTMRRLVVSARRCCYSGTAAASMMVLLLLGLISLAAAAYDLDAFVENVNMNPCEDFYTYICESQYKYPDGSVSSFKSLVAEAQDNVVAKLRGEFIFSTFGYYNRIPILEDDDAQNVYAAKIARIFYASCMDTETIDAQGIIPIESVLKELRGWPLTRRALDNEKLANWQDLHAFYSKINVFPLYEIAVNNDALRRTHTILVRRTDFHSIETSVRTDASLFLCRQLRQPKPVIREPLLYKAKSFYKYVDYIKSVAMVVANLSETNVSEQEVATGAKQVAAFEAELSKILEVSERLDFYRPILLGKFQNITNQLSRDKNNTLDWVKIINGMYPSTTGLVSLQQSIDISTLSYFPRLIQLLYNTPSRTVVNFIHWRFVHQFLPHTSGELRNSYFEMRNFMHEPVKNMPRWRFCGFEPTFDHVISHIFAKKHLSAKTEKYVQRVLSDIKQVTLRTIKRSSLLNEDEKRMAERKILSMSFVLGIPEPLKNLSVVNSYYKKLTISKNYFTNVLTLRKFYKLKEFEAVKKNEFKSSSDINFMKITTISSIGSAYEFFENRVLIKAENLMAPLFDPDFPEFKKYGILGFIIAYEIMHAFNDADSIEGTRPRRHLYSEETKLKYWNKMECFINQFDNYYIPDPFNVEKHVYVDGERSAMENIADSTAIQIAFQAYRERSRKQGVSSIEDDEDLFASFASLLCRPELEEFYLSRFNLALRTLPRFRVIGSLSNTNEFAKTFSCSSGARMNPETKCNFWN
ncbi:hypothetical protein TSAR_015110 [Trichomalopsis sarcophagae]|uniref:Peptidase M13 N-terminal domain-containing protein n=1 Tax=Trichomalopsis sarcophagae TaxID=543379 RepID=A0A232F296_9HYME|nr:hypothetical protein TSAR_015110 [Trichomalopsis sarcophagae]